MCAGVGGEGGVAAYRLIYSKDKHEWRSFYLPRQRGSVILFVPNGVK